MSVLKHPLGSIVYQQRYRSNDSNIIDAKKTDDVNEKCICGRSF